MYEGLTATYRFTCPSSRREVRVRLSSFRSLERLPGTAHPAVYDVTFACPCGGEHEALLRHDQLDWAPLAPLEAPFYNVMTGRLEHARGELAEHALAQLARGRWPWRFFCRSEARSRPVFPSAFRVLSPSRSTLAVAARCPSCGGTSANLVSAEHLDVPFYCDREVGVIERPLGDELGFGELVQAIAEASGSASRRVLAD